MNCPNCNVTLLISNRHDIEIDYCPQCRGIWLDRGELDKIVERSAEDTRWHSHVDVSDNRFEPGNRPYKRKKKSLLGELFDID